MLTPKRTHLDNAATSFPKPDAVCDAVDEYNRNLGVSVGRSAYRRATQMQAIVDRCRKRAANLFRAESPDCIVFTFNCTDSLNLALHGVLRQGDHVVTSLVEHNSVRRPLTERLLDGLASIDGLETYGPSDATGCVGVVSVSLEGYEPQILATTLDENFGIETRAGMHCAPGMHKAIGTFGAGGTTRFSVGPFTTLGEIDRAISALREIAGSV